jgi:peptidoglycan/xylan/chitin deacetylase (PgdA/CDA1 family)
MNISKFLWKDGKRLALTSCWDDGTIYDRQLVAIFNRYGLNASFNLCSGKFGLSAEQSGWKEFIRADEVAALYQGHEVCSHTVNHPRAWSVPVDQLRWEILEDRRRLEALVGYPVRGFVIPYNWAAGHEWCIGFVRSCGFKYMRHTASLPEFEHPADFMDWHPTAHCSANLPELWVSMLQRSIDQPGQLFYLWGHSYEFDESLGWDGIEAFAALAGGTPDVWHATKGEIYDYVTAWRRLEWSLDGTLVRNNSAILLWFLRGGQTVKIESGRLLRLDA